MGNLFFDLRDVLYPADGDLDTLVLQISQGRLVQHSGPHVDLPSQPIDVVSSPDGARLYVSLPFANAVAVVE